MTGPDILQDCIEANGGSTENATALLICVTHTLQAERGSRDYSQEVLLIISASLVFFMQAGFAMVCAGAVRKKNVQNTLLKNFLDACGGAVTFWAFGYAFAFGGMDADSSSKTFIGHANFFLMGVEDLAFWTYQYAFAAAAATIIAGTLAERCQMVAYLYVFIHSTSSSLECSILAVTRTNLFFLCMPLDVTQSF
jgi:hypothetical protein